jgi:saccharopine dehydrogenase-like NADP-dependent oxidoreductase
MNVTVLGAGLVGLPMAIELAKVKNYTVRLCDNDSERLNNANGIQGIECMQSDLKYKSEIKKALSGADLVINAVPGHMGYKTLKDVIESGKNAVDIAFFPEDMFELEELALKQKVIVFCDAGVAPGMSNILAASSYNELDEVLSIKIYVGGLPRMRKWPFEYKAGFSPIDVLEEYTRPARFRRNGVEVIYPALSEPEFIDFKNPGTLEAFNSDGLRSLLRTLDCPDMVEKTLRYPGHREKMLIFKESGFLSQDEIEVDGKMIKPIDITSQLLFPLWKLEKGEADITVMYIEITGRKGRKSIRTTWELYDELDPVTGIHSMARTTGFTATGIAEMILDGSYSVPGMHPPEDLSREPELVERLLDYLKERNIHYIKETKNIKI